MKYAQYCYLTVAMQVQILLQLYNFCIRMNYSTYIGLYQWVFKSFFQSNALQSLREKLLLSLRMTHWVYMSMIQKSDDVPSSEPTNSMQLHKNSMTLRRSGWRNLNTGTNSINKTCVNDWLTLFCWLVDRYSHIHVYRCINELINYLYFVTFVEVLYI